ncbi:MAG: hypothetical protein HOF10_04060 [Chloroflexi bacterium]|jgi:hypothetical protein|nr:hypothetical protein [Chloroflexota bacterium]MBT4304766.1 hypothetical protein [Chloroflexota bacterium]MBT4683816.1 hypothetical protein [Chloroflexota bacterium]MBT5337315.1 hypothetical protein [Chloroflexota bacterium]MBT6151797.1 hypothetical protein [Chloroflexota bacterium]
MNAIQNFHVSVEILFWEKVIALMTESPLIIKIIRKSYIVYRRYQTSPFVFKNFVWVYSGLTLGLIFGFLSTVL